MFDDKISVSAADALAKEIRSVGITGTNGKSTTTAWVAEVLAHVARPVACITTLGSSLDKLPLSVPKTWDGFLEVMRRCHAAGGRLASLELTSEALARGFAKRWPTQIGVFTNLSHDHLDAHGSAEHYLASKAQLFVHLPPDGTAVLNGCDEATALLREVVPAGVRVLWYGVASRGDAHTSLDLAVESVELDWTGTAIRLRRSAPFAECPDTLVVPGIGEVFAENGLAALLATIAAGVPSQVAVDFLARVEVPKGRFEVVGSRPYVVVDYAHTPDALRRTLETARRLCRGKLWVVFGAGGDRDRKKRRPMGRAARAADRVVLTSDNPRSERPKDIAREIRQGIPSGTAVRVELDRARAIEGAIADAAAEDVIVIAGKGHETEQITARGAIPFSDGEVARVGLSARGHRHG
jgi:UDP-N-acetylmuramoyl-L-alanyl-D-glutamate--2,6-diaminopimelate ligase